MPSYTHVSLFNDAGTVPCPAMWGDMELGDPSEREQKMLFFCFDFINHLREKGS